MKICSRQGQFELMSVNHSAQSGGIIGISFDFLAWKVCCVFSLESPHRGYSNEYTQYTIFNINTKNQPKLSQICSYEIFFSKGLKSEFKTAVVNESAVFEPLRFYCNTVIINFYFRSKTLFATMLPKELLVMVVSVLLLMNSGMFYQQLSEICPRECKCQTEDAKINCTGVIPKRIPKYIKEVLICNPTTTVLRPGVFVMFHGPECLN